MSAEEWMFSKALRISLSINSHTGEIQTGQADHKVLTLSITDMLLTLPFPLRQEVQQIRNKEAHTALASESSGSSPFRITVCISGL